jgi:hypothetical protein
MDLEQHDSEDEESLFESACAECRNTIARLNCDICSEALCHDCVNICWMKFSDTGSPKANSDYERVQQCATCIKNQRKPTIVVGSTVSGCSIQ